MQAVDRILNCSALQNDAVASAKRFHRLNADFLFHQLRHHQLGKTSKMRIHQVGRHQHRIEMESVFGCDLQHVKVNMRILVAGKADEAQFAGLPGFDQCLRRAALTEDAVGIIEARIS